MRLEGKTAIVTGAGTGIGQATARKLSEEGATVVANDLRREYLEALMPTLSGDGHLAGRGRRSLRGDRRQGGVGGE